MIKNPPHKRTKTTAQTVTDLLTCKVPLPRIGYVLNIDEKTLRRRYSDIIGVAGLRRGKKAFEATPLQRDLVKRLAAVGTPQSQIASFIGVGRTTLANHLGHEIKTGMLQANIAVGTSLLRMATGPADRQTTVTAAIWWSKARMEWRDSSRLETTGADGGAIQVEACVVILPDDGRGEPPGIAMMTNNRTSASRQGCQGSFGVP